MSSKRSNHLAPPRYLRRDRTEPGIRVCRPLPYRLAISPRSAYLNLRNLAHVASLTNLERRDGIEPATLAAGCSPRSTPLAEMPQ